jgi:hypothetical protein
MVKTSAKWVFIYLLEAIAVVLALGIFLVGTALWRLSAGPVPLEFLREDVQARLALEFEGDLVVLGALEARFDPDSQALVILARDVAVAEADGEIVARAPLIEAGFAVDELLIGRVSPVGIRIVGGSVSIVRRADGAVGAGLGSVDRVAGRARQPQVRSDDSASLFELLRDPANSDGMLGRLTNIEIQNAAVRLVDQVSGFAWLLDDASVLLDRNAERILASVGGSLATPSGFAPIEIRLEAGASLESLMLEARAENLSLAAIAPDNGLFSGLRIVDAPLSLDLVVNAFEDTGIRTAALDLDVGEGQLNIGDEVRDIDQASLSMSFDPVVGELTIREGMIVSDAVTTSISGRVHEIGAYFGAFPSKWRYDLEIGQGHLDIGPAFVRPPSWEGMVFSGQVDVGRREIGFDRLAFDLGPVTPFLAGTISLVQVEDGQWYPNIVLSGGVEGDLTPDIVKAYWPLATGEGAREWVETGIIAGRFYNAAIDFNVSAESIAARDLPNDNLTISFDFENALIYYITTMSPLEAARGRGVLYGNSFEVELDSGRIGDLRVSEGSVLFPRLNPKGAMARYAGYVEGEASDILALIDEEPLFFVTNYGIDPATVGGAGGIRFDIRRAMLSEVEPEDIPFEISGEFSDVTQQIPDTNYALTNGLVRIDANQDLLTAEGDALFADTAVHIIWQEDLTAEDDAASTTIEVSAQLGARALDAFGIPARRFLDGHVLLEARAISNGLDVRSIDVDADLIDATLEAPGGVWVKAAGTPGMAGFTASSNDAGNFVLEEFVAESEGLDIQARGEITPQGRLVSVDTNRVLIEGFMDMSGSLSAPVDREQPLQVRLEGAYLDARELIPRLMSMGSDDANASDGEVSSEVADADTVDQAGVPLSLEVNLSRLMVADDNILDDFGVIWRSETNGVRAFLLAGRSRDGPFHASFGAPVDGANRDFRVEAQSLGRLVALFGLPGYATGGQISVLGQAPPLGVDGPLIARVEIRNLTLTRVPVFAQILAAGSFEGLGALFNGDGISFDAINATVMLERGLMTLADASATGSALGVTAAGTIDFEGRTAAIDGNLAPSYVLNSFLGDMPLIGEILISRPGEGIFGITYSVEGPFDGLTVFANPLSALAPGVFRRIFEGSAADRAARLRAEDLESDHSVLEGLIEETDDPDQFTIDIQDLVDALPEAVDLDQTDTTETSDLDTTETSDLDAEMVDELPQPQP